VNTFSPTRRAVFEVTNPRAQPTDGWIRAVARMLLAHVDKQIAAERAAADAEHDPPGDGDAEIRRAS